MTEFVNPTDEERRNLLQRIKTIAVVGLSPRHHRPSNNVARNLQQFGYRIIPVNPGVAEVLGERAYARLEEVPGTIDLVDVFRAPEHVPGWFTTVSLRACRLCGCRSALWTLRPLSQPYKRVPSSWIVVFTGIICVSCADSLPARAAC